MGHGPPSLGTKGADEVPCWVNKAPLVERIRAELAGMSRSKKGGLEMGESTQRLLLGLVAVGRDGLASGTLSPGAKVSVSLEETSHSSKHRGERYLLCLLCNMPFVCRKEGGKQPQTEMKMSCVLSGNAKM